MATRKLVEIPPQHHEALTELRSKCRKQGLRAPSIPAMVAFALERGMPYVLLEFSPKGKVRK